MKNLFKKFRFSFRFLFAFWQKHQKLILLSFLVGILCFLIVPKIYQFFPKKRTEKIGLIGKFTLNDLPLSVQHLISDGLTTISEDGQVQPFLASSWQTENENKEYLFTLKENFFWQDGKPVLAKDINYNFSDVATTVIDDKKIKFILKEPFSPFPAIVSRPVFKKGLVGTGDYKLKKVKKNGQIVEKIILVSVKNKDKTSLVFHFYPTEMAARTAFKLGEIDVIKEINDPGDLQGQKNVKITQEIKYNRVAAIFFDTQNPKLAAKATRQALAYAIEKRWQPRALNPINPQSWAFNPTVKKYEFDLAHAQQLLEGDEEEGEPLKEIELATIPSLFSVAEEIKKDWQKLGIETKIKSITTLNESLEALLISQEIPSDPDQYVLWHSTQKSNITGYKSPKIDKLLEEARKSQNQEERKEIYHDFQRFLVEDTPAVFLFHPTLYTVSRI